MKRTVWGVFIALAVVVAGCGGVTPEGAAGPTEGIAVHGDWKIEVYDPDGTLAESHEFSNHLTDGGRSLLAQLLTGVGSSPEWEIVLGDLGGLDFTGTSPCTDAYPVEVGAFANPVNPTVFLEEACYIAVEAEIEDQSAASRIILNGSVDAARDGTIDIVETQGTTFISEPNTSFFETKVFTRNTEIDPVDVTAGQTIQVTVEISFTSG